MLVTNYKGEEMSDNQLVDILGQLKAIKAKCADTVDKEVLGCIDDCILEVEKAIVIKPTKERLNYIIQTVAALITIVEWLRGFF